MAAAECCPEVGPWTCARRSGLVSAASLPVVDREQVVGVVATYDQRLRSRSDAELERLRDAALEVGALLRAAGGLADPYAPLAAAAPN